MSDEPKKAIPLHRERLNLPDNATVTKLREEKLKQLKNDFREIFNSPAGRRVLRHMMMITGYKRGVVGGNPTLGMDVLHGTLYNASRLQVMVELIELIPDSILKDCEFGVFEDLV